MQVGGVRVPRSPLELLLEPQLENSPSEEQGSVTGIKQKETRTLLLRKKTHDTRQSEDENWQNSNYSVIVGF